MASNVSSSIYCQHQHSLPSAESTSPTTTSKSYAQWSRLDFDVQGYIASFCDATTLNALKRTSRIHYAIVERNPICHRTRLEEREERYNRACKARLLIERQVEFQGDIESLNAIQSTLKAQLNCLFSIVNTTCAYMAKKGFPLWFRSQTLEDSAAGPYISLIPNSSCPAYVREGGRVRKQCELIAAEILSARKQDELKSHQRELREVAEQVQSEAPDWLKKELSGNLDYRDDLENLAQEQIELAFAILNRLKPIEMIQGDETASFSPASAHKLALSHFNGHSVGTLQGALGKTSFYAFKPNGTRTYIAWSDTFNDEGIRRKGWFLCSFNDPSYEKSETICLINDKQSCQLISFVKDYT